MNDNFCKFLENSSSSCHCLSFASVVYVNYALQAKQIFTHKCIAKKMQTFAKIKKRMIKLDYRYESK